MSIKEQKVRQKFNKILSAQLVQSHYNIIISIHKVLGTLVKFFRLFIEQSHFMLKSVIMINRYPLGILRTLVPIVLSMCTFIAKVFSLVKLTKMSEKCVNNTLI